MAQDAFVVDVRIESSSLQSLRGKMAKFAVDRGVVLPPCGAPGPTAVDFLLTQGEKAFLCPAFFPILPA
jgi:hypothetical protein